MRKSSRAVGARRGRLSSPWLRFHGGGAADVYIIIRVRASGCGESALNPPTSPPIPRRRPAPAPAQRRALPEHFRSPTQRRCTPADLTTHFPPKTCSRPRTTTRPPRALSHSPTQPRHTPAGCAMHSSPTSPPIPRRRSSLAPPQRHALPEHFRSPPQPRRPPADLTTHSPPKICSRPRSATLPPPPFRFGHKKNGTAQCMCDAECLGRPSLRSVIGVGEPRAVRRRCGALAWRVGLRPQPWALRSRRCGRVLRA